MHRKTHTGEKPFSCPKFFYNGSSLKSHWRTHKAEKPFSCEHCSKSLNLKTQRITQTGEKHFPCKDEHLIRSHTGEKPFSCDHCSKSLKQDSRDKDLIKSHTGERPFSLESRRSNWSSQTLTDVFRQYQKYNFFRHIMTKKRMFLQMYIVICYYCQFFHWNENKIILK